MTRQIVLEVASGTTAGDYVNYAEISVDDGDDVDSTPNATDNDDAGGQPGSAADDHVDGNGTGGVGDGVAATDEDDHDPAEVTVEVYDLALRKNYVSDDHQTTNDGIVAPGTLVTFDITVINQGTVAASNVQVIDYVPSGFTFPAGNATNTANGWSAAGSNAVTTIPALAASGQPGDTVVRQIVLEVDADTAAGDHVNYAEISVDDGDDVDSVPDTTDGDDAGGQPDSPADDHTDGDGTGTPGDGVDSTDEDDHDPADVEVERFDLALRKSYTSDDSVDGNSSDGIVNPGTNVTFTIEVFNQGSKDASNIELVDFVDLTMWEAFAAADNPAGTTSGSVSLPFTWSAQGTDGRVVITGTLPAGQSLTLPVVLTVEASAVGTMDNYAEIAEDNDDDIDSEPEDGESDRNGDTLVDDRDPERWW